MRSKLLTSTFLGIALFAFQSCRENNMTAEDSISPQAKASGAVAGSTFSVPVAGNSFLTVKPSGANEVITSTKLGNWTNANSVISTYFRVSNAGTLNIGLKASVPSGTSVVKVTVGNVSKNVTLTGSANTSYTAGDFNISTPGYVKVDLQGVSKTGGYFADVTDITFSGTAASGTNIFSNDTSYYYWARRGPSCHLGYTVPTSSNVSYYYNEVTVPVGEDKIGSYFMANGFGEGYFGIQVNSATERRVLFSVWSPFPTDDPNNIPPDHKIVLNRAGSGVTIGEFGNEGSGGQSYYKYNWTAGQTYKFLLKGEPDGTGKTDYTAWFLSPDTTTWKLIASWKRPQTSTYLKGFYSFVENFNPENGYMGRKAEFKNQWVRTSAGNWQAVSAAKFTVDATYNAQQRIDAMGGTNGNSFFLQNGGFFSTIVAPGTQFSVTAPTQAPDIDFSTLP
ncbi:DUF3472 domain-containing protein [Elizabethkingia anophelis]|uniref:DUF3472 domain-containing protein n=1 Tax=Elizabethkingia anophelis TaxID=1117645 RepID=UPI0021A7E18D|nr:DUF3472 domain-containing protein [Elizabethkingia anophelis]MCT3978228.1 DUF3472 domain-containing protein [Elizabethkingia anophelis]MCT4041982.1 DUF3472 domain-containing protein [Elizabethkingia anophelis]MCT4174515.1 DUF3472 domain-containing protein [Elizabethkingia anophelis]MCT4176930.1 DUF3472 domain-containing protein [Elizabethkingia anophelis]